jgi:anaerobic selenocysteine-containing dehydrogenase
LCIARCGAVATVEGGRFTRLDPDPSHPTGQALCAKGRAAPEIVASPERLTHPLRRTRPKGDPDPGWERIGWDEALDLTAAALRRVAERHGPEAVAFTLSSPSTTAIGDSIGYIQRLANAFGTPNAAITLDVCGWGRAFATRYSFGVGSVGTGGGGGAMPDIANSGLVILWGYNPSYTRITHATAVVEAVKRGTKLIVVDPRHVGLAAKADLWLRVRPGSDGALALGIAHVMIERGWYDRDFIRRWSNGPLLVRADTGRLLTEADLAPGGDPRRLFAWDAAAGRPIAYDVATGYAGDGDSVALEGEYRIPTRTGTVLCHPAFELYARLCRRYPPAAVEAICWIPRAEVEAAAGLIWESRPVSYYAWSGHEQHANVTQTARAMSLLYALTGSFDQRGGNLLLPAAPAGSIIGQELPAARAMAPRLGIAERPLGPARFGFYSTVELYRAIREGIPYPVRALLGFGANMLLAHAGGAAGRAALQQLDFYAHLDLFMNPTAALADIVLPVASAFEREGLKIGFEISQAAQSRVQLRPAIVPPPGEARPDTDIVFALARRLGLGAQFWDGDVEASYRHQLAPLGLSPEQLRASPGGLSVPLETRTAKHAEPGPDGAPQGFATPSRKVELYSETFLEHGYPPLPEFEEPRIGPARQELAARFPLVLTSAKAALFCQTQHRQLPSLRRRAPDPAVELHPAAAEARGIASGDWVAIETPDGSVRARARLNATLDPRVVVGEHGWWQGCAALGASGFDPFGPDGANFNRLIGTVARDPVSGTASHRSYLCEIRPLA